MAWGTEAQVRILDFIIMTWVTLGTCPSLQAMRQTRKKKGFQDQILGHWAERARDRKPISGFSVIRAPSGRRSQLGLVAGGPGAQLDQALALLLSGALALPASLCRGCHQDGLPHSNNVAAGAPGFASVPLTGLSS